MTQVWVSPLDEVGGFTDSGSFWTGTGSSRNKRTLSLFLWKIDYFARFHMMESNIGLLQTKASE